MAMASAKIDMNFPSEDATLVDSSETDTPQDDGEGVAELTSKVLKKVESAILYAWHEIPSYQQNNHYIISGYRGELLTLKRCFQSLFYLHNESGILSPH
jgi:hypothetical protein